MHADIYLATRNCPGGPQIAPPTAAESLVAPHVARNFELCEHRIIEADSIAEAEKALQSKG